MSAPPVREVRQAAQHGDEPTAPAFGERRGSSRALDVRRYRHGTVARASSLFRRERFRATFPRTAARTARLRDRRQPPRTERSRHGPIVGEIDRFAHVRYHGIQAKFESSISKSASHGLVQDATEAFADEFRHPQTGAKHRISSFYAVNAGTVSDEARALFFSLLRSKHGDNVRLLEGRDLVALDRSAAVRAESTRNLLLAMLMETRRIVVSLNRLRPMLQAILEGDGNTVVYPVERLRLVAVEAWLAGPVLVSDLPSKKIEDLHSLASAFNRSLDEAGGSPLHTVVSIKVPAAKALRLLPQIAPLSSAVESAVAGNLAMLGSLAPL